MAYNYGGGYGGGGGGGGGEETGGGGFVGGSQGGSQDTPGGSKTYTKDTLRPVTIKQLIDATQPHPSALFVVDGVDIATVTIVGQIQSVIPQHTNTTYKLDDGTGLIEVKQWTDAEADPDKGRALPVEGQYLRVCGKLKEFSGNGKRHLGAHLLKPVVDYNEISYHFLEATAVHLYFTRGPPDTGATKKEENGAQGMFVDSYGGDGNAQQRKAMPKLSMNGNKVFKLLESTPQSNEGLHVSDIAGRLAMPQADVFKAGDELLGEGMIYTTVDDETWAVLEY